ncbi:MAG: phospholipid/cholesterol/gamma-HCH transport system substrate-binding protein [Flavobacteriaceae bacterium]
MKFSKEIITGVSTVLAIGLLVTGVNFLKGNSFFGGDDVYYAYFPNSGGVSGATSVYVDGVEIGKVLNVEYLGGTDSLKRVKMTFNIQLENFKIIKESRIEAGAIDLFTKGLNLILTADASKGNYKPGDEIQGFVTQDIMSTVEGYADPITQKLQTMMVSVNKMVDGVTIFWDETASSEIEASMREVKLAIKKFGSAAEQIENLVATEKIKISRIMTNVQQISENLKNSNDAVRKIVGNMEVLTDDLVSADFKSVIGDAQKTLQAVNSILDAANQGEGTLGKLLSDEALYNELVNTNVELQGLLNDLQLHPEKYIHFSVFGGKPKYTTPLTSDEEKKLKEFLLTQPKPQ